MSRRLQLPRLAVLGLLIGLVPLARAETPVAPGAPITVTAAVEPRSVTIGTPFRYTLRIEAAKDVELVVPTLGGQIGEFQVVDFGQAEPRQTGGRVAVEHWYTLVTYATGDRVIPGPTVQYTVPGGEMQSATAPDAVVIIESLLDRASGTPATDVRDIKGPVAVPHDYTLLGWIALGVAALIGVIALLFYWVNRPRRTRPIIVRPPHELALEALARLRADRLVEQGRQEEFYVRLSAIVRGYLEARFRLRAPEMTTEEFLQAAQRDPQMTPPQRARLAQFLSEADLVKFARHQPTADDADRAHDAARELVTSTTPSEVPRAVA
ncbi:MAG: DUF4381 family protein [Deltaproteobacteria bacterium]|nr:DUF4381 family protein [Deltaproteobacteria bacterium]